MTIMEDRLTLLDSLVLESGGHQPDSHFCVMEAAAYIAGEPWSDHPECVSPVIGEFLRTWNDSLNDDDRQMLKPYVTKIIGTRTTKADETTRVWLATDWLARECAPAFLRCAGLTEQAELLEALAPLMNAKRAQEARAALSAAHSATRSAVHSATLSAARSATLSAVHSAALSAAHSAAGSAARSAALSAALSALDPTVKILQISALGLLDRMIEVGQAPRKTEAMA